MLSVIPPAGPKTRVLLVHAPYPGRLKFEALPSSLLHAFAPFAESLAKEGREEDLGYLDPIAPSVSFTTALTSVLLNGQIRAVCISSSTAAIEETATIVSRVRTVAGDDVLVLVGGPHEDASEKKSAEELDGVDLSIAGDAEYLLDCLLGDFLERDERPADFCRALAERLRSLPVRCGQVEVTSRFWDKPRRRSFDWGRMTSVDLHPPAWIERPVHFDVFDAERTLPLLVSRGCSWGRCTFCSEPLLSGGQMTFGDFDWVKELAAAHAGSALYFQDSIFPMTSSVRARLLPMLRTLGVEWGCQVFLPTLSRETLRSLAESGCRYVYTGLESTSSAVLAAVGKPNLNAALAKERLGWTREFGMKIGLSLMFGTIADSGEVLETSRSIDETVAFSESLITDGVKVVGFYPNVETVYPGTTLARSLERGGMPLDFYRVPTFEAFADLEDGGVGHNFATLPTKIDSLRRARLVEEIRAASLHLQGLHAAKGRAMESPST